MQQLHITSRESLTVLLLMCWPCDSLPRDSCHALGRRFQRNSLSCEARSHVYSYNTRDASTAVATAAVRTAMLMCCSGFSSGLQASHRRSVVRTCSYEPPHNHLLQHPVSFPFLLHWSHFPVLLLHGGSGIMLLLTTTLMYRSSSCKRSYDRGVGSTRSTVVPELVLTDLYFT